MEQRNVVTEVVKNDLCIGCGVCAGVCPSGNLKMDWNEFGEYNPYDQRACLDNCSLCLSVCPFVNGNDNEDILGEKLFGSIQGIRHTKETGYYLSCHVGFSPNREVGASGGMVTWMLETMLQRGLVDKVICVAPTANPGELFKYRVMDSPEEVRRSAGSAYYPVHLSNVIEYIRETPGNYVITALPCFAKALRLASQKFPKLQKRIRFILGLTCGQLKSSFYTRYIAFLAGVSEPIKTCHYRGKDPDQPASNYTFTCEGVSGKTGSIRWNQGVAQVWTSRGFTPLPCNYCDDVFAELADATFMDAWLPGYSKDPKGTSLAIVRDPGIRSILEGSEHEVALESIPVSSVIRSQVGVIAIKREHLAYRLHKIRGKGVVSLTKRVSEATALSGIFRRQEIDLLDKMQQESWQFAKERLSVDCRPEEFLQKIGPELRYLEQIQNLRKVILLPIRVLRKIIRKFRGAGK